MIKICLVFLVQNTFDLATIFERAFQEVGADVEVVRLPAFWMSDLTSQRVTNLKNLLEEKSRTHLVIFSPGTAELFLKEADCIVLYSAYRSWFERETMRVIPHLWTPVTTPENVDDLRWNDKPPLRVGFMGRSHSSSRLAKLLLKSPTAIKEWWLRGLYLRSPRMTAFLKDVGVSMVNINAFVRIETLNVLNVKKRDHSEINSDIIERTSPVISEVEKDEYKSHLRHNTYIVCPRGTENYSFRIYEALSYGRIPVIIDTEIVLPKEIEWEQVSLVVPYERLNDIYDIILDDYNSKAGSDFIARQHKALSTIEKLRSLDWVRDLAASLVAS